jgi:hypothetical protein
MDLKAATRIYDQANPDVEMAEEFGDKNNAGITTGITSVAGIASIIAPGKAPKKS